MRIASLFLLSIVLAFKSFPQNYTILGSASPLSGCNCFRLTPDANDQGGAIYQNKTINLNNSFDFTFSVFLGCRNGNDAADGIVFVLTTNPNGLGLVGEYLGYGNGSNQPYSLAVEFDTWENGNHGDPPYDHIAIESGGSVDHTVTPHVPALPGGANIDNCQWYTVRIVWDVNTGTYSVYFNGTLAQQIIEPDLVNRYFGGNPIVNWGWSGATGGGTNDQRVCVQSTSNWVAGVNYQSCDLTLQFTDISTSNLGAIQSWAWDFGDGGTSSMQNPTHTYPAIGTYTATLTISDISGCTNAYSHDIVINPPIVLTPTFSEPPCNGGSNGAIYLAVSGGFGASAGYGGYQYTWDGGAVYTQDRPGITAGTHTVSVTDGVCSATGTWTLDQPPPLTATTSHTDASCANNDGSVSISISGGTPPYTPVSWGPGLTGNTVTGLPMGVYVADFRDFNGCTALLRYTEVVNRLPCGVTASASSTSVSCYGGNDGTATLTVTGGAPPVTITWSNGGSGPTITGLSAGTYSYNYSDGGGNAFSGSVTVNAPAAPMVAELFTINMSCASSNDGQALASVTSGGVSPYHYAWSGGQPDDPLATGLSPGAISVTITDASGCTATASGTITGPPLLTLTITTVDDSCYRSKTGSATAVVSGGNPPYTYYWDNISTAATNLNLGAGTYTVTVTDDKGCTISGSAAINEPAQMVHTIIPSDIDCYGNNNGSIVVNVTGGTPAYNYLWSPASISGNNPTGLSAGQYKLTITDANNCTIIDSASITEPAELIATITDYTDVTCYGANNGIITLNVNGGTPPYTLQGNAMSAGDTIITGLAPDIYTVTVADSRGCDTSLTQTIAAPGPQSLTVTGTDTVLCAGATNGIADADFVNATGNVTYSWTGGLTGAHLTGLAAGTYEVTATDANNCTLNGSVTIAEPPPLIMPVSATDARCFGGYGQAIANPIGAGPFTFSWSTGGNAQIISAPAGNHSVTATDANSCEQTGSFTINQPSQIVVSGSGISPVCLGDSTGSVTFSVSGGTPGYAYTWSPAVSTTNAAINIPSGTYSVTVTDANQCTMSGASTLTDPPAVTVDIFPNPAQVQQGQTVQLTVTTNQSGTLDYVWTPQSGLSCYDCPEPVFSGLETQTYTLDVTTAEGCPGTAEVTVTVISNVGLFIPNAFSPDGNGRNDYFEFFGSLELVRQIELKIFDRWGSKLFESFDLNNKWDGTHKGKEVNPGVYVYTLKVAWITNHRDSFYKGSVTVLR